MPRSRPEPIYRHDSTPRTGVLLVNLGTPAAPTSAALRPYLKQAREKFADRLWVLSVIASADKVKGYEDDGYLVFEDPTRAVAASGWLAAQANR